MTHAQNGQTNAPAARLELRAAVHWQVLPPFAPEAGVLIAQLEILAQCIGAQVEAIGEMAAEDCGYALATTVLPADAGDPPEHLELLFGAIERRCGHRPEAMIHPYMCAGWGYAVEFYSRNTALRRLMLSIVDVDPLGFRAHTYHPAIGNQGFGITTVLLTLPEQRSGIVTTGAPPPARVFPEFVRNLRMYKSETKPTRVFLPYLRADLIRVAESALGSGDLAPNRALKYSHCFGSDPFIGIIEWLQQEPLGEPVPVLVGGLAFNGYFAFSTLMVSPDTVVALQTVDGADDALMRAASAPVHAVSQRAVNSAPTIAQAQGAAALTESRGTN